MPQPKEYNTQRNQSANQLLLYIMTSQEFVLFATNYVKQEPKTTKLLDDATINENAKILTLLQRQKSTATNTPDEETDERAQSSPLQREIIERRMLKLLSMMKP